MRGLESGDRKQLSGLAFIGQACSTAPADPSADSRPAVVLPIRPVWILAVLSTSAPPGSVARAHSERGIPDDRNEPIASSVLLDVAQRRERIMEAGDQRL